MTCHAGGFENTSLQGARATQLALDHSNEASRHAASELAQAGGELARAVRRLEQAPLQPAIDNAHHEQRIPLGALVEERGQRRG